MDEPTSVSRIQSALLIAGAGLSSGALQDDVGIILVEGASLAAQA